MNILHSLYLLVPLLHLALAGPFFKAGFIKGALKGLLKGQNQKSDDRQCQVKWEEVWKPHCSTSYEQVRYSCHKDSIQFRLPESKNLQCVPIFHNFLLVNWIRVFSIVF